MTKNNFLKNGVLIFKIFTQKKIFFLNLAKNKELKKIFINIINEYINFVIKEKEDKKNYKIVIDNLMKFYRFQDICKDNSYKKVYFEIIDCFLRNYTKNLDIESLNIGSIIYMQKFLNRLFSNKFYLENITDFDIITKTFEKIANFEFNIAKNGLNIISTYIIEFYIKFIATIPIENFEKNSILIKTFEVNINKFLKLIIKLIKNSENSINNKITYYVINKILYNPNINFQNDKFNNKEFVKNIENTFQKYIEKIVMLELIKIGFDVTKINKIYILNNFLYKDYKILEKYNFKNIFINKVIKILEKFYKKSKDRKLSENIYLEIEDKKFLEFVFLYDFIDIKNEKTRILVFNFLEIYSYKISRSTNNIEDLEFFIILSFSITNLVKIRYG